MPPARLRRGYAAAAVIFLNVTVLFVVVNLLAAAYFALKDRFRPGNPAIAHARTYGISMEALGSVYPGSSSSEIGEIFRETWLENPLTYEPFSLFRERPHRGKYLNVDPAGFRVSDTQGPWPVDRARFTTVFVFGGSTTFGYGVQDSDTIVSHLQRLYNKDQPAVRPLRFYNFGRGYHYLSQERILLQQLISAGAVPDLAVFVDGLNDFAFPTEPAGTARFREAMEGGRTFGQNLQRLIQTLPVTKAAMRAIEKLSGTPGGEPELRQAAAVSTGADRDRLIQSVVARYLEDKKLIEAAASVHGIKTFFVWQPVPTFRYDLKHHIFARGGVLDTHELSGPGYAAMDRVRPVDPDFIWCADIQTGVAEPLYVDPVHYSGPMNGRIARCIAAGMKD